METRSIFVLENRVIYTPEVINKHYESNPPRNRSSVSIRRKGLRVLIDIESYKSMDLRLPKNYDCYWLHYSMTSSVAIRQLREDNPLALIAVSSGGVGEDNTTRPIKDSLNEIRENIQFDYWHPGLFSLFLDDVFAGKFRKENK